MNQVWTWITGGIAHLLAGLKTVAASIVMRVLGTMGLTVISLKGVLPQLKAFVLQFVSGMPAEAINFLGAIGLGQAMSMVFSALTVQLAAKTFIVPKPVADSLRNGGLNV